MPINTRASLYGICNPGGQNPWAVGSDGTIVQQRSGSWVAVPIPSQPTLNAIAVDVTGQAVAVGDIGALLEFDLDQEKEWTRPADGHRAGR